MKLKQVFGLSNSNRVGETGVLMSGGGETPDTMYRVYDSFNRDDGALGSTVVLDALDRSAVSLAWTGATWAIVTNAAKNTPTLGTDLWEADAAAFTSGTYGWVALGGNGIANVGNALAVTYVNNAGGAYCALSGASDLTGNLTPGQWYKFSCDASINTGTCEISIYTGNAGEGNVFSDTITTTPSRVEICFLARHATGGTIQFALLGAGEVVTIDNLSLVPIINTEIFASVETLHSDIVTACVVGIARGRGGGLMICMDSATAPTNYIQVDYDGKYIRWRKCVNGTLSTEILFIETNQAYQGLAEIAIEKNDTTVKFWYHGKLVGTKTVSDVSVISNKIHGMFSTDPDTILNNYTLTNPAEYVPTPNLFVIGDSITAGLDVESGSWAHLVAKSKVWKLINMAHPAVRVIGTTDYYMTWQVDNVAGANTIICLMGTNDTDTSDTMRAAYQARLSTLITNNPTARIIALGCLARTTNDAEKVLISAQIAIAAGNVDVEYHSTHDWIDPATDCDDGLHPNASGRTKILNQILAILSA